MTWNVGPWSLQKDYLVIVRRKILSLWWGANPWCSRGTCYFQWFCHAFVIFFLSISCFCFLFHCIHPSQSLWILWDSMEIPRAVFWALICLHLLIHGHGVLTSTCLSVQGGHAAKQLAVSNVLQGLGSQLRFSLLQLRGQALGFRHEGWC
jgi:hypothetical protein